MLVKFGNSEQLSELFEIDLLCIRTVPSQYKVAFRSINAGSLTHDEKERTRSRNVSFANCL